MTLENGSQGHNSAKASFSGWNNQTEQGIYRSAVALSLVAILLVFGLDWLKDSTARLDLALVQLVVGGLVFCFTVFGDGLAARSRPDGKSWEWGAITCALIVIVASLYTGEYLNIMLIPLLLGVARRRENMRLLLWLGSGAIGLIVFEAILFAILGLKRPEVSGASTALMAITAITLSLATFLRHYQTQVKQYQSEAASKASEMEVAHEIQTSLMPPNQFTSGHWTLAARSLPAKDVGGDFYEYIPHPHLEHTVSGIAIGDVAGKGIPAALQMAVVRTLFRVEARRRIFPGETLMSVNMALQAERSFGMVTMLYAFIDIKSNSLHLANAGHNYPLLVNGNHELEEIVMPGLPLGIDDEIEYEEKIIKIMPGTSIIFYTDGVVEAMDSQDNLFTFERLREAVENNRKLDAVEMVDKILEEISLFTQEAPQSDDITVLVLQYAPKPDEIEPEDSKLEPIGVAAHRGSERGKLEVEVDGDGPNWI